MTQPLATPPTKRIQATFCFVDLAGFTALTEAQGDDDAADVATRFADIARASLGPGDCLIKTIGDAVFIMSPTATSGIALVERMLMRACSQASFPHCARVCIMGRRCSATVTFSARP